MPVLFRDVCLVSASLRRIGVWCRHSPRGIAQGVDWENIGFSSASV